MRGLTGFIGGKLFLSKPGLLQIEFLAPRNRIARFRSGIDRLGLRTGRSRCNCRQPGTGQNGAAKRGSEERSAYPEHDGTSTE